MGVLGFGRKKVTKLKGEDSILNIVLTIQNNLVGFEKLKEVNIKKGKSLDLTDEFTALDKALVDARKGINVIVTKNDGYNTKWWVKNVVNLLIKCRDESKVSKKLEIIRVVVSNIHNGGDKKYTKIDSNLKKAT